MSRGSPAGRSAATVDAERLTTVFRLLARPRRRRALYALRAADGPVPVVQLADRLLAREEGSRERDRRGREESGEGDGRAHASDGRAHASDAGGGDGERVRGVDGDHTGRGDATGGGDADREARRERVETALRHVHLPKLTAAGAVERGPDGAVRYAAGDVLDDWVARAAAAEGA